MADSKDLKETKEPRDSGPLELHQLSDHELATIIQIERRLFEAQKHNGSQGKEAKQRKYLAQVQNRQPRVLLLDGNRGTGKTSILLTLADRWHHWSREKIHEEAAYKERIEKLNDKKDFVQGEHDGDIPGHVRVVGRILDFDPLPPSMPLIAGIVQAWRQIVEEFDRLSQPLTRYDEEGETLLDLWHSLFRVAAVGWTEIPQNQGLLEQVLDRQEQIQDWHCLDQQWQSFVDAVIECGANLPSGVDKLPTNPIFVLMIDDVDLQVGRVRELLPALRTLYHPNVFFVIAADQRHMIEMLALDFLGQQNRMMQQPSGQVPSFVSGYSRWPEELARSSFQKVFPLIHRWELERLTIREVLEFSGHNSYSIKDALALWPNEERSVGAYLEDKLGPADSPVEFPPTFTYRTVHQIAQKVLVPMPTERSGLEALRLILGGSEPETAVRVAKRGSKDTVLDFRLNGEIGALFRSEFAEPVSGQAEVVLSSQPDFFYRREGRAEATYMSDVDKGFNFGAALIATTLRDDDLGVEASGLRWNVRLAIAWTRVRMFDRVHKNPDLDLAFQWRLQLHPSPLQLLKWAKEWSAFIDEIHTNSDDRLDRLAYGWIYYELRWGGAQMEEVSEPFAEGFNSEESWQSLLDHTPDEDEPGQLRWSALTLPLLARPEIGLTPETQERLLQFAFTRHGDWIKNALHDQRRRLVTDAILAAAEEARVPAEDAEDRERVQRAIDVLERRHRDTYRTDSPWYQYVEAGS